MNIYEENLKALVAAYPNMDKLIEEAKETLEEELEITEEQSYDGDVILKVTKEGKTLYLGGKRDPIEPARIWVDNLGELLINTQVYIMGVGNWFYLKELVERTENKITIIVYEPSLPIFIKFLEHVPIARWMEKHLIVFWVDGLRGMDEEGMRRILARLVTYEKLSQSKNLILPNYDSLFVEKAVKFYEMIRDLAKKEIVNYNTQMLFSEVMVKNLLANVRYLCDGYKTVQLVDVLPNDIPGIVVAAGPSLNKNIHELKKAKGKAFIIAVDTAIKPLLNAGIVPDMFAIVDGLKPLMLVEREEARQIPIVSTFSSSSEVLAYHTGMKFFANEGIRIAEKIMALGKDKRRGNVDSGGSVATNAFSLLYKIGITRIILVGQDLAYTNNKSHADGTFSDSIKETDTSRYIMVEGNIEDEVPTISNLKGYRDWYEDYIEKIRKRDEELYVINATEGGAKIKGTEIMTLKEAIERECTKEVDIQACLAKLKPWLDAEEQKKAKEYLASYPEELAELAKLAKKAKRLYTKLDKICDKKNIDSKEYLSVLKKIEKNSKEIEKNEAYHLVYFTMINAQYILSNEQFFREDTLWEEGKEIARKGILYTDNVAKMATLFQEYTEEIYAGLLPESDSGEVE